MNEEILGDNMNKSSSSSECGDDLFHVLAVDDSHIDRMLLQRLLTVSSYQVTCVDSGDKALEYLGLLHVEENSDEDDTSLSSTNCSASSLESSRQDPVSKVNLIMTDFSMPGISGYDLLKRVKESSWKDIPVVVMSSENVPSRINMCLEGGAEEFLVKPVKLSDLKKLHSHLIINSTNNNNLMHPNSCEQDIMICTNIIHDQDPDHDEESIYDTEKINDKNCCSSNSSNKRKPTTTTSSSTLPLSPSDQKIQVRELSVS